MSWLTKALGIGAMFIPGVGPAIGSAILGVDAALEGKKASEKAADQQVAAGEAAIKRQEPWANVGASAIGTLGSLMGLGGAPGGAPAAAAPAPAGRVRPPDAPVIGQAMARPQGVAPMASVLPNSMAAKARSASSMAPAGGGQAVRMQAPTGQIVMVPAERVQEALQQGGQVVG